jgi:beta-lactamase regulating signal transducer with metallopeptidase domain
MIMVDPLSVSAIALKTSLLVVVVGLIAWLMAKQSAAWRHALWTATLVLSLLMPIAVMYLPSYAQVPLPWPAAESTTRDEPVPATGGVRVAGTEPEIIQLRDGSAPIAEREIRAHWPTAMIVWLIGALAVLLHTALAHVGLLRWRRKARSGLSPAWTATLRQVARESGFRRSLRVLESDHATSPCTWGFARPVLLLPASGAQWPESLRRFALLHEFAHIRRFDYLTTQISNLACAVHWYNPFVWLAAAQARKLQEQACDDAVLNAGGSPSDYAQFLVGIADGSRRLSLAFPAAVGMVQRSELHGRVIAILDASRARLPLSGLALLVALVPLACLMLFLATVSAVASPATIEPGVPLAASFNAVELRNGGRVTLVHGESPRVTVLQGDPEEHSITVRDDGRLVIDHCAKSCSHRQEFEVEVVTPGLAAIAVAHGGTIQSRGNFPSQPEISASVNQGGTIDIRSMPVENVTASVYSGGRIFAVPAAAMTAKVEHGGNITYWGDAAVESAIQEGGVVVAGTADDFAKSLADLLGPALKRPPPVPPVPPAPAIPALQPDSR